jgi:antitoxin component of MazEF toxin-antitoxin module
VRARLTWAADGEVALELPDEILRRMRLEEGDLVKIEVRDGALIITKA